MRTIGLSCLAALCLAAAPPVPARDADETLPSTVRADIDRAVHDVLDATGAPSASIAIVRDGALAYANAYGAARLEPHAAATPRMRYSIGSISKQFTAGAILMLAEQGRLSLDDPVGRWLPDLTRASDVTIRQILSMTSGYQDFWAEDYVMPTTLQPITAQAILDGWARRPLDFEPGTRWQYSNTNYVIAGLIAERAGGVPIFDLLAKRVFTPLGMMSVVNTDLGPLGDEDAVRYRRFALGPPRPAPKEGQGWMFAAGELAMTASDLARWDISLIDRTILQPSSYRALETEVLLTSGVGTGYGLGVSLLLPNGRRLISHGGEVSGFTARNDVYPDDRLAIVALVNLDATDASQQIAARLADLLFSAADPNTPRAVARARTIFDGLQHGRIDRSLFTANANAYFTEQALRDFASSLAPLGAPDEFTEQSHSLRGGMIFRRFRARFAGRTLSISTYTMPDGLLEQYLVAAVE